MKKKKTWKWTTHEGAVRDRRRYWHSRSPEDRVSAIELLRVSMLQLHDETPASEWSLLLEALSSQRVRFLVVGSHALGMLGVVRFTCVVDILVEPTLENARRLGAAMAEVGYVELAKEWRVFATRDRIATMGSEAAGVKIMTSISGVDFAQAWKGRGVGKLGKFKVGFLGRKEFIINKRASGRTKDLLDLALLEEIED